MPGTAGVGASHDPASSNYYSNNFGVTGGLTNQGGRPHYNINTPAGPSVGMGRTVAATNGTESVEI